MSRASRAWKKACKAENRREPSFPFASKQMTLASYRAQKRYDQRFYKAKGVKRIKRMIEEMDAGNVIAFNPFEDMVMVEHDGISHPVAISGEYKCTMTTTGGNE